MTTMIDAVKREKIVECPYCARAVKRDIVEDCKQLIVCGCNEVFVVDYVAYKPVAVEATTGSQEEALSKPDTLSKYDFEGLADAFLELEEKAKEQEEEISELECDARKKWRYNVTNSEEKEETIDLVKYIVVAGNPSLDGYTGTVAFTNLIKVAECYTEEEANRISEDNYEEHCGLIGVFKVAL